MSILYEYPVPEMLGCIPNCVSNTQHGYLFESAILGVRGGTNVNSMWTLLEISAQEFTNTWRLHTYVYQPVSDDM